MLLINPVVRTFYFKVSDQFFSFFIPLLSFLPISNDALKKKKRKEETEGVYLNSAISWILSDGRSKNNKLEDFKWKGYRAEQGQDHVANNAFCKCRGENYAWIQNFHGRKVNSLFKDCKFNAGNHITLNRYIVLYSDWGRNATRMHSAKR